MEHADPIRLVPQSPFDQHTEVLKGTVDAQCGLQCFQVKALARVRVDLYGILATDADRVLVVSVEERKPPLTAAGATGVFAAAQVDPASLPLPEIELQQRSHRTLRAAQEDFERLAGLIRRDDRGYRRKHPHRLTGRLRPRSGRLGEQTTQTRAIGRHKHAGHSLGPDRTGVDVRNRVLHAQVVEDVSGLEVVAAVDQDVGPPVSLMQNQLLRVMAVEIRNDRVQIDLGVNRRESLTRGDRLGTLPARVRINIQRLPVQIGHIHQIPIDEREPPDPGSDKQIGARAAQRPHTNNQGMGRLKIRLSGRIPKGQPALTRGTRIVSVGIHA